MLGLREKLALISLFAFFLIAGMAVPVLYARLQQDFVAVEVEDAATAMRQLARNFDSELARLNDLSNDWSNWDGLYAFASDYSKDFAESELGSPALLSAQLNLMAVIDRHGVPRIVRSLSVDSNVLTDSGEFSDVIATIVAELGRGKMPEKCGLSGSQAGLLMLCWQPIHKADRTGGQVGSLVLGRILDKAIVDRMRQQSALDFDVISLTDKSVHGPLNADLALIDIQLDPEMDGMMTAHLTSLDGSPVAQLNLRYSQQISQRGQRTAHFVAGSLMLVVILAGLVQFVGAHVLVVRPVRSIGKHLRDISSRQDWSRRIGHTERRDELGEVGRDINELLTVIENKFTELEEVSMTDALTRIANRRSFASRLEKEMRQRLRTGRSLSLLFIDIDYFKRYNDRYGHPAGDAALINVATVLANAASRPGDLAARVGGEEFAIILPDTDMAGALALAERLRVQIASCCIAHAGSDVSPFLTLSIGATEAADETADALVARADAALYRAKADGRHRVVAIAPTELATPPTAATPG